MVLPLLGGSPAVWTTCLVFFQSALLAGYGYSHYSSRLGVRRQVALHVALLIAISFTLPITVTNNAPSTSAPTLWLMATLIQSVGLPFLIVATTSPLLQRWYASTRAMGAGDPYFLSIASNLGSLVALLAYPLFIEPHWTIPEQAIAWKTGYWVLVGLVALCGLAASLMGRTPSNSTAPTERPQVSPRMIMRWVFLSMVPSSLLVGVTNSITTDVAPIPLLWVVPLALYLVTFIIAFAPGIRLPHGRLGKALSVAAIALGLTLLSGATEPLGLVLGVHLGAFFAAALVCHGRLAAERPPPESLTAYYLWMAVGGAAGGAFNAIVAPLIFRHVGFAEYPLALLAACLLRVVPPERKQFRAWDIIAPVLMLGLGLCLVYATKMLDVRAWLSDMVETTGLPMDMLKSAFIYGLPLIVVYTFVERPLRFALGLGALFLASSFDEGAQGRVLLVERNFLGVIKVTESPDGQLVRMVHGNTVHGQQRREPRPKYIASHLLPLGSGSPLGLSETLVAVDGRWDDRRRPLTYYHPNGPAGVAFRFMVDGWHRDCRIGAVGLGTGALASYAKPDQDWTFFELDPDVERIAREPTYFTYLRDSRARSMNVVIGDARIKLAEEPDGSFDLLVLDAFSSDAIPIHLLTAEAFQLYLRKLKPNGVILMHVSNRYLDLPPIVAAVAQAAEPPLLVRRNDDLGLTDREVEDGKSPSIWLVLARDDRDFGPLVKPIRGYTLMERSSSPRWTDDRANLLQAVKQGSND